MSVILYQPVQNIKSAIPLFRDRNIAGVPADLNEYLTPIISSHTPNFIHEASGTIRWRVAALMQKKEKLEEKVDELLFQPQNLQDLPLALPPVHVVLKKSLSDEEVRKYKLRKITAVKDRKSPIFPYSATFPTFEMLKFLGGKENVEKAIPMAGSGNVQMLRTFRHARRIIYAISLSMPVTSVLEHKMEDDATHSIKTYFTKMDDSVVPSKEALDEDEDLKEGFYAYTSYYAVGKAPQYFYISKPSEVASVPFSHAVLFPFFYGMTNANGNMVKNVLSRFNIFSDKSSETAAALLGSMLQELQRPLNSKAGQELNHLAYGIVLCHNKNCKPIPLVFGRSYVGFLVVSSFPFSILNQHGRVVNSVIPSSLVEEAVNMSTHERAVEEIAKILSALEVDIGSEVDQEVSSDDIPNSRCLITQMFERSGAAGDASASVKAQFRRYLNDVVYDEEHPISLTFDVFKRWARCLRDDKLFLGQYPDETDFSFIKGIGLTGDITEMNCAIFGGLGWSPLTPGGDKIVISDPNLEKIPERTLIKVPVSLDNGKVEYKDEYPLRYIVFHRVPIPQAAKDWDFVAKHGYITIPKKAPIKKELAHKTFITEEIGEWWTVFRKNFFKPGGDIVSGEEAGPSGVVVNVAKYRPDGEGDDF